MGRYVAFLRGINLGPTNKISMPALKELTEGLGYTEVSTYINSGNVIMTATDSAATIERRIAKAIKDEFGLTVDVAVRTPARLATIVAENPYPDGDPSQVTVAFLTKAAPPEAKDRVAAVATENEPFTFSGQEVYVHYRDGLGKSKLAREFSAIIKVSATVRNLNTLEKILARCAD